MTSIDQIFNSIPNLNNYWELLLKWNEKQNLISSKDNQDPKLRHLADSLAPYLLIKGYWKSDQLSLKYLETFFTNETTIADIGSGPGLPGIPLALAFTKVNFVLIEPRIKRVNFLRTIVSQLSLKNAKVFKGFYNQYPGPINFDGIVSRATLSDVAEIKSLLTEAKAKGLFYRSQPIDGFNNIEYFVSDKKYLCYSK